MENHQTRWQIESQHNNDIAQCDLLNRFSNSSEKVEETKARLVGKSHHHHSIDISDAE